MAAAAAALPALIAAASVVGSRWNPSGDWALEYLRVSDVAGEHTPLVGAWSRWGFNHPGPLLFWMLAPFEALFGTTGVLFGAAAINAAATAGAVAVASRRGGVLLATLVSLISIVLVGSLGLSHLVDIWNPSVPVMVFWLFGIALWSASLGDTPMWLVVVAAGTFCMQTHIGYVPLVAGLVLLVILYRATVIWVFPKFSGNPPAAATEYSGRGKPVVWVASAIGLLLLLWIPPLVQQLTSDEGNISLILEFARSAQDPAWGWELAYGFAARHLGTSLPWVTGNARGALGLMGTSSSVPALLALSGAAILATFSWRRGFRAAPMMVVMAIAAAGVGLLTTSRMSGDMAAYLLEWWRVIAALLVTGFAYCALGFASKDVQRGMAQVIGVTCIALAAWFGIRDWRVEPPLPELSDAIAEVMPFVSDQLDPELDYVITGTDLRLFLAPRVGLFVGLEEEGLSVFTPPTDLSAIQYGDWRVMDTEDADAEIHVVEISSIGRDWQEPENATLLASSDPLSQAERDRFVEIESAAAEAIDHPGNGPLLFTDKAISDAEAAGIPDSALTEAKDLQLRDTGISVYLIPAPEN